jgi:hypothetical protein
MFHLLLSVFIRIAFLGDMAGSRAGVNVLIIIRSMKITGFDEKISKDTSSGLFVYFI